MNRPVARDDNTGFWRALPFAVLAWAVALWLVGHFLMAPRADAPPQAVDARIVELPETPSPPQQQATPVPPKAVAPPPPVPQPRLAEPVPEKAPAKTEAPAPPAPKAQAAAPAPPPASPVAASPAAVGNAGPVGVENHGVRLAPQVVPELPDDLQDAAAGATVTAVFHVAADGNYTIDLSLPPAMPLRARKIILDQLQKMQATPRMVAGKPVASTVTLQYAF